MIYEFYCILHCTRLCGKFLCCAGRLEKLSGYSFMVLSEIRFLHGRVLLWVGKLSNTQSEISPAGPVLQGSQDLLGPSSVRIEMGHSRQAIIRSGLRTPRSDGSRKSASIQHFQDLVSPVLQISFRRTSSYSGKFYYFGKC